jgi:hypothetical protein
MIQISNVVLYFVCRVCSRVLRVIYVPGTGLLPGPVSELHATAVTNTSVTLQWEAPTDGSNVTDYEVHYQQLDNTSMHETVQKLRHVSTYCIPSRKAQTWPCNVGSNFLTVTR